MNEKAKFTTETQSTRILEGKGSLKSWPPSFTSLCSAPIRTFLQKITKATKRGTDQTSQHLICLRDLCALLLDIRKSLFFTLCVSVVNIFSVNSVSLW